MALLAESQGCGPIAETMIVLVARKRVICVFLHVTFLLLAHVRSSDLSQTCGNSSVFCMEWYLQYLNIPLM